MYVVHVYIVYVYACIHACMYPCVYMYTYHVAALIDKRHKEAMRYAHVLEVEL